MSWYHCKITPAQVADGVATQRMELFLETFRAAGAPRMMALFQREQDDGGLDFYLTPDCREFASELLVEWTSVPCTRPSPIGLQFLVGHNEVTYYLP